MPRKRPEDQPFATITHADVMSTLKNIQGSIQKQSAQHKDLVLSLKLHDARLRNVEKINNGIIVTIFVAIVGFISGICTGWFSK